MTVYVHYQIQGRNRKKLFVILLEKWWRPVLTIKTERRSGGNYGRTDPPRPHGTMMRGVPEVTETYLFISPSAWWVLVTHYCFQDWGWSGVDCGGVVSPPPRKEMVVYLHLQVRGMYPKWLSKPPSTSEQWVTVPPVRILQGLNCPSKGRVWTSVSKEVPREQGKSYFIVNL